MRDPEERGDQRMPACLLKHPFACIHQHQGEVGRGCPGHHVARVLDVSRGVGDDELPPSGREEAIGDIDGDPLLALGAQAVGQEREVELILPPLGGRLLDRRELVVKDRLRVVQKPADKGRLPVVDASGGRELEKVRMVAQGRVRSTPPACGPPWPIPSGGRRRALPARKSG